MAEETESSALAGLVALVRDTEGKATAAVVAQALRRKRVFHFAELLAEPAVQRVRSFASWRRSQNTRERATD